MSTLTDIRLFETGNGGDLKLNGNSSLPRLLG